jgi:DNA-binding CsgD family transcriptional regulator
MLSARLALERVRTAALALEMVGLPAAVLGNSGRPLAVNALFESLMPQVVHQRLGRLHIGNVAADQLFSEALAHSGGAVHSIPIPATHREPAMILHIVPVRGEARDIFSSAAAIAVITPVAPRGAPAMEVIQGLFDLTPAEARVAREIIAGRHTEAIATSFGVSRETVRSQIRSVLAKTGVSRRTDLVAMLAGTRL